jgi:ketosteroid isomerase-like protein
MGEARDLAERVLRAIREEDRAAMHELFAPDAEVVDPLATARGPDELLRKFDALWEGVSDVRHQVLDVIESDDTVVLEMRSVGKHARPMAVRGGRVEATGKELVMLSTEWVRVRNGRIRSWHSYYDATRTYLEPLGLMPPIEEVWSES